ncbi:MAG: hypothetical protein U0791_04025 [Gemmataceae bacterium]
MMHRLPIALVALFALLPESRACTFCSGPVRSQPTLRMRYAAAKLVIQGTLKNPRFDPNTDRGYTDFHFGTVLKDDPARKNATSLTLPQYLPVIGGTPPDYLVFCDAIDGKLEPQPGLASRPAVVEYLKAAAALDPKDPAKALAFFFRHLDSADAAVSADAFLEFARASDAEILQAAVAFDPAVVRKLIANPDTPLERLGVYAFLLGSCGKAEDAAFLAAMLKQEPLPERTTSAFGGLLAGFILLDAKAGWPFAAAILADEKRGISVRFSVIGTVRFFQATRGAECRAEVLKCCAALVPSGDLADQAIDDLRRWGWWDLTKDVLAQYGKPTHSAPLVKRGLVRYALQCPDAEAKAFIASLRTTEPKLVKDVEDGLARFAPKK